MTVNESIIRHQLQQCMLPEIGLDLSTFEAVKAIQVSAGKVIVSAELGFPFALYASEWQQRLQSALQELPGVTQADVTLRAVLRRHHIQANTTAHPKIKNIIAIASGKGGVGKSTTAVNLALALTRLGASVGVLDADIYGPNQPHLLGVSERPQLTDEKKMQPLMAHGVVMNSIGLLVDPKTPTIWRGPMVSKALEQLYHDTLWPELDYLLVDLPPGTGDIQLTLCSKLPVSGAAIVTTPQALALLDARKGLEMFRKVNVSVLGVIENMSLHRCSACGHEEPLFGSEGAAALATHCQVPLLGQVELSREIRQAADIGVPLAVQFPDSEAARRYSDIALRLAAQLALKPRHYGVKFPTIVVE